MARIRTIKPEFWSHPIMARQSDSTRLLAIALLNHADDEGYFLADPNVVRGVCRPCDENSKVTKQALETLNSPELHYIEISHNKLYGDIGWIVNFRAHQKIDRPNVSKIKQYFISSNDHREVIEQPPTEGKGMEGKGKERKGSEEAPARIHDPLDNSFAPGARVVMTEKDLRSGMSGQIFIEQSCMALGCSEDAFKKHLDEWVNTKVATGDFLYPINKLKTYCLSDFKKMPNGKQVKQNHSLDNAAADLEEIIRQSKRQ